MAPANRLLICVVPAMVVLFPNLVRLKRQSDASMVLARPHTVTACDYSHKSMVVGPISLQLLPSMRCAQKVALPCAGMEHAWRNAGNATRFLAVPQVCNGAWMALAIRPPIVGLRTVDFQPVVKA